MQSSLPKSNYQESVERFGNWWQVKETDRPVLELPVCARPHEVSAKRPGTLRERWMDPHWRVESALAELRARPYVAETRGIHAGRGT